ncbi:MAG: GntR family transcriptional regulator [Deltaproteobacteria bacterium]|nr:GntR family transcriptional regulator [Deltaproteobacteria bacterium]MBW2015484.1 GntR family transcriptional regulator [Deltaproteobacteria bacterium]MBW2128433.1 GntR family transcriptional regulator [Deltaproteobacteria bacterium]MBW2303904.1 GntR family transcriptional regulator [Deltaproteobacteria bacterium]
MKITVPSKMDEMSLTERVYRDLRNAIITGQIPGGTRMIEAALADQMGVSRTPVREALKRFAQEGLVYSIPRAGYVVEDLSDEDVEDLFAVRTAIEQIVARWALPKITDEEISLLKKNLDETDEVLRSGRTEKMIDLDIEFHHIIYKACRSKRLYLISKNLGDHTLKFRIACIHIPEIAERARDDHKKIYQAIAARDPVETEKAISAHLMVVKEDILSFLKRSREKQFIRQGLD